MARKWMPEPYASLSPRGDLARAARCAAGWKLVTARELLHEHFCRRSRPSRFFFAERELPAIARAVRRRFPRRAAATVAQAEDACGDRVHWGGRVLGLGPDFPWCLEANPIPNRDQEFTAAINRMFSVQTLATAYWYAGRRERYAEHAARLIDKFLADNEPPAPYRRGMVWRPDMWGLLQTGLRLRHWVWAFHLLRRTPAFSPRFLERFLAGVAAHAEILSRRLNVPRSNHATMEMMSLLEAALSFPEFSRARVWRQTAVRQLCRCLRAQVRADGGQHEASPGYHCGCIGWFAAPLILARLNGLAFPPWYARTIERMVEFAAAVRRPDRALPPVGDTSLRGAPGELALGALLFGWRAPGAAATPETLWIFGPRAAARLERVRERPDAGPAVPRSFPDTGVYVLASANGSGKSSAWALVQCRERSWGGHAHADSLSFEFAAGSRTVLADAGVFTYAEVPDRKRSKETAAHNTVTLDGVSQVRALSSWQWAGRCRPRALAWRTGPELDFFCGEERSWQRLKGRPRHRRALVLRKGPRPYLLIVDWVLGAGRHRAEARFHFDTPRVEPLAGGARSADRGVPNAAVLALGPDLCPRLEADSLSHGYNESHAARTLGLARAGRAPFALVSLVVPLGPGRAPAASGRVLSAAGGKVRVEVESAAGGGRELLVVTARGCRVAPADK